MSSPPRHARPRKILRTGRHARPSQAGRAAVQAGKAAPVLVLAGALITVPLELPRSAAAHPARPAAAASQAAAPARPARPARPAAPARRVATDTSATAGPGGSYTVLTGDSLASIAGRFYGSEAYWPQLWQANARTVANPWIIYPGQVLALPRTLPAAAVSGQPEDPVAVSGTLSCAGLEDLWETAGGAASEALTAAKIATAESGGQQYATGHDTNGTEDIGYFQVNTSHGPALATYSALGNAAAAVQISGDGTDWLPWTTFRTDAYSTECP